MNHHRQGGISIVELLVAVAVGLILTIGLISMFVSSKQGYRVQESRSRMQENARFAADYLTRAVRLADFWGSVAPRKITAYGALTYAGNSGGSNCKDSWAIDPGTGIRGYDGGGTYPGNSLPTGCISNYVANSDALVVRYADPDNVVTTANLGTTASAANGKYFLRVLTGKNAALFNSKTGTAVTSAITAIPEAAATPGAVINYRFQSELYYLGNFDTNTPSLYVTRNQVDDTAATPLVDGIEMMQLEYGLDTDGDTLVDRYANATGVGTDNWGQVISARISLVVRGDSLDNFSDDSTYSMAGGYSYTPPSSVQKFQRLQIVKEVQIRNRVKPRRSD